MKGSSRKKIVAVGRASTASRENVLFARVVDIIEAARRHVVRSVNTAMVQAYWLIGREIVQVEQHGAKRAGYGDEIIDRLAKRLAVRVGEGFGARTLWRIRQFYVTYPEGSALPVELGGQPRRAPALSRSTPRKIPTAVLSKSKSTSRKIPTAALSKSKPSSFAAFPPLLGSDALPRAVAGHESDCARILRDRGRARGLVES